MRKFIKQLTTSAATVATAALPQMAMAAGGLASATTEANAIKVWLYGFLGVAVFVYVMYFVIMAMLEKKQWADVLMALGKSAVAGGSLAGVTWAWGIWGS